jgi:D-hexose-6-phosphate mutarotase
MVETILNEGIRTEPILLHNSCVSAEVSPLGAFVNSLAIDGNEVVFARKKENPKRGGIPVLGPTPGPVTGTGWENLYPKMPQHGKDREVLWKVENLTEATVTFERMLGPKEFLFNGKLTVEVELLENGLRISKLITNFEDKPREIGSAFHPYFAINGETKVGPDGIAKLYPPKAGKSEIIEPGLSLVTLNKNNVFYRIQSNPKPTSTLVWTDDPDQYVCIEPWWAEKGKGDIVGPSETKKYSLTITKDE